jgi:hypothetical protein
MENGRYVAFSTEASVYEKDGKLLLAFEFQVGDEALRWFTVLFYADEKPNKKMIRNIRGWSGWDGIDPYWLQDAAKLNLPVEVTVAWEADRKDDTKQYCNIKWVDKVGGGGGSGSLPEPSDRASVMAKWGAKFRAEAGPQAIPAGRHTPVKTATPPSVPPARVPPPAPARPPPGGVKHTQSSCWDALQAEQPDTSQAEIEALWYTIVTGDQATMTGSDWAKVADAIERLSVKLPADEEPLPF